MGRHHSYQIPFAAYPAVRILIFMAGGILTAKVFELSFLLLLIFLIALFLIWGISEFFLINRQHVLSTRLSILSYLLLTLFSTAAFITIRDTVNERTVEKSKPLLDYAWENITINGKVRQTGKSSSGSDVYLVDVKKTGLPEGFEWSFRYSIRLYSNHEERIFQGEQIYAIVRLYEFPERRNPHDFDYGKWLHNKGIVSHGELVEIKSKKRSSSLNWLSLRSMVQNNTEQIFKGELAPLAKALFLGYKEELTQETRAQFSRSGLSHIMAVSGLHVGFIVAPFWIIIPYFWGNFRGKWFGLILLTLLLIGYAGLTGFSASVSRASLMAWLITFGKLFHKTRESINLTAVAAIILLLIKPNQLFEVGFQLSFAAVFIILLIMPEAQKIIPLKYRFGKIGGFLTIILVSIVVQLGLYPILAYYFGEFSVIGPVSNALVVPVLTFTVPLGLLFAILSPLSPAIFKFMVFPIEYSLEWINRVAITLGGMDYGYITAGGSMASIFIVWLMAIFLIATIRIPTLRWKMLIGLLLALNLFMIEGYLKKPQYKNMEITFLDVGQGDAAHIVTPNGRQILVDAGRWSPFSNSGERILVPYFEKKGINRLDAVILSHPHADHIGGMPALIKAMEIGVIYQSDYSYDSVLFKTYMKLAAQKGIEIKTPGAGDIIDIDPSVRLFVLGPETDQPKSSNPNNRSLVFKLSYGDQSMLFTGDAEAEQERQLVSRYGNFLKSNLYKSGHHGSNTSSTALLMSQALPEITVVSLAFRNSFRHPGRDAVLRLQEFSEEQKYTSLEGAVLFETNGTEFNKVNWR